MNEIGGEPREQRDAGDLGQPTHEQLGDPLVLLEVGVGQLAERGARPILRLGLVGRVIRSPSRAPTAEAPP